jgi:hypothetical protein
MSKVASTTSRRAAPALLAICGDVMLFMQLVGREQQTNRLFVLGLVALRWLVSVGYLYLCRTKHIRCSGLARETAPVAAATLSDETRQLILAQLAKLDHLERAINWHNVTMVPEPATPAQIPATTEDPAAGDQPPPCSRLFPACLSRR